MRTYLRSKQLIGGVDVVRKLGLLKLLREGPKGGADLLGVGAELLHRLQPEGGAGSWRGEGGCKGNGKGNTSATEEGKGKLRGKGRTVGFVWLS